MVLTILMLAVLSSCGNKPKFMHYDAVFNAPLGDGPGQVGNNILEQQKSMSQEDDFLIREYLDVPTSIAIYRNKLYLADKYNKVISIFNMTPPYHTNQIISQTGEGYSFDTPFQLILNKYGEIYVIASEAGTNSNNENPYQYFIYKFSYDGQFMYRIGKDGQNTGPMTYPDRVDVDIFNNLYVYHKNFEEDSERETWAVTRFSDSGELNFKFDTRYLSLTNTRKGKTFVSHIQSIYNLKNDEQLLVYNNHHIIKNGDQVIDTPNEFYHSMNRYSVLQNSIISTILESKTDIEGILGVTDDDVLVLYSYREQVKGIRFRFISIDGDKIKQESFYAPVMPGEWNHSGFYIDPKGDIYSIIIKDLQHYVLLRWRKRKSAQL